ncbi:MAG: hypothetical protein ACM3PP_07605 [Candidatus Saccharibacteria bacterium]
MDFDRQFARLCVRYGGWLGRFRAWFLIVYLLNNIHKKTKRT